MQIRMTNTAIKDCDLDIAGANLPPPNREGTQRGSRALCGVGFYASGFMILAAFGWFKTWSCVGQPSTASIGSVLRYFGRPGLLGPLMSFNLHFHKFWRVNWFRLLV
jgi:hypothetical protein